MNTQLWYTTRKKVQKSSIDLCSHQRFDDYLARSYSAFDNCSSYISKLRLDFQDSSHKEISASYPFTKYSLAFFKSTCEISRIPTFTDSDVAFFDLLHPICSQLTLSFFNQYHSSSWFSDYIKIATKELVIDLSECLSPSLFDLFSESIPFGLRIQRVYQHSANPSSSARNHFNLFLETTLSNCFADLIQNFPVSIYLIGQTIYTWHHRHFELLDRLQLHCQHLFDFPFSNLSYLSFSADSSGDNHNFHRRSYVFSLSFQSDRIHRICYKPRPLDNDEFFFDVCEQFLSKYIDHQLVLPRVHNFGSYGFTEFISSSISSSTDTHDSLRRDGIWLFILWLFGFTDCTFENFIFDGTQHVLIDFETAFTGFFSPLKTPLASTSFSPRAFLALSSTRTTLLPRWDLSVDDRIEIDVSCFGNRLNASVLNTPLWFNTNNDYMIYYSNHAGDIDFNYSNDLSDSFISTQIRSDLIIEGFRYASSIMPAYYKSILDLIDDNSPLSSRFIFRDTAAYARLLLDIFSPSSLSSASCFLHSIDKLDRILLDHPSSDFVRWIVPAEKLQLFNLDIPYFSTDINANSLVCCFGIFDDFSRIYNSGLSFVSLIMRSPSITDFQPLLIDSSLHSSFSNHQFPVSYSPYAPTLFNSNLDFLSIWSSTLKSSFLHFSDVDSPFLLIIQSGLSRKDVQIENLRPNFLSGSLGIYYSSLVYLLFNSESSSTTELDDIFHLYQISLASYYPLAYLNSSNCGLEDLAGFYYGLKIASNLDVHHIQPCSTPFVDSLKHFHSHLATDTLKSDLFSGVSGLLTASLSCSSELNDDHLFKLLDLLLSFQTPDGLFLAQRDSSKNLPLGIAHGIHGILITLLHFYAFRPSHDLALSIHRLVSAYNLTNLDLDSSFNRNFSWCSGLSGHLIVLSYLSQSFPEYRFDGERIISNIMSSCHLDDKSDLYFCCGLSGVYASILYISLQPNNSFPTSCSSWFSGLKAHIINSFSTRLSRSNYELMKPSLLDGFSIFPLLASNSLNHLNVLESILLFKSW